MRKKTFLKRSVAFTLALLMLLSSGASGTTSYAANAGMDDPAIETSTDVEVSSGQATTGPVNEAAGGTETASPEATDGETMDAPEAADPAGGGENQPIEGEVSADGEDTDAPSAYAGYAYGDPEDSTEETTYVNDLDEIIRLAEEGMDLDAFFAGSKFEGWFGLEDLYELQAQGATLEDVYEAQNGVSTMSAVEPIAIGPGATARFAGYGNKSGSALGSCPVLGNSRSHGAVGQLSISTDSGTSQAFCGLYGSNFRSESRFHLGSYSDFIAPNGHALNSNQDKLIQKAVATYLKTTGQTATDYVATQLAIWYIINNPMNPEEFYWRGWWEFSEDNHPLLDLARRSGLDVNAIGAAIETIQHTFDTVPDGAADWSSYGFVDNYPGKLPTIYYWVADSGTEQNVISWDLDAPPTVLPNQLEALYINNYYIEKEAVTKYFVDVTKESIITNELLKDIQFLVVESEAPGNSDLDYDIFKGTLSEYGNDYPESTTSTFGQAITVVAPVPYMDDDVEPSGGQHRTTITTDENGFASTTFVHKHTFREFYSECYDGNNAIVDYATYQAKWAATMALVAMSAPGMPLEVLYKGETVEMTPEELTELFNSQQIVYTQKEEEARATIDDRVSKYEARTYKYTVTELDTYTRAAADDSNGKHLDEITLPKEGYRKDIADTTTIGSYVEILKNGQTMHASGKNDQDPNTDESSVTNEPWQNQIFINKTDLETGSQILYDTEFEIYEYYKYKAKLSQSAQTIRPYSYVQQIGVENDSTIDPGAIASGKVTVTGPDGNTVYTSDIDVEKLRADAAGGDPYTLSFTPAKAGAYKVTVSVTIDHSTSTESLKDETFNHGKLTDSGDGKTFSLDNLATYSYEVTNVADNVYTLSNGATVTAERPDAPTEKDKTWDGVATSVTYTYRDADGNEKFLLSTDNFAGFNWSYKSNGEGLLVAGETTENDEHVMFFVWSEYVPTGYTYTKQDDGSYIVTYKDGRKAVSHEEVGSVYNISRYIGACVADGEYSIDNTVDVSSVAAAGKNEFDYNVGTDINDYRTWGQDNYEIVRVTPEIAEKMGWSHTTIGMYTVHRKSATDAYTGTTFTEATDHATSQKFGYQEYGTLYYTQANLGHFAIVEKTAPADGDKTGYLGNYGDRDYSYLDDADGSTGYDMQSSVTDQKNYEGAPKSTDDSISTEKYVHYIHLCPDTNQYATYQLTDGLTSYSSTYYDRYVEEVEDEDGNMVATEDGYDAKHYDQSSLTKTIGLEDFALDGEPIEDVLNEQWDTEFTRFFRADTGIQITRDSEKTDTWFSLDADVLDSILHHFVGTTINNSSYDYNDSTESNITYDGTYTDTNINYNSYSAEADALNARDGFNGVEYMQVGDVTYDNAETEKNARYYHTESATNKESGYSFIDEREYGYIRFSKYDTDAERYVDGDIAKGYVSGTDHADGDLDGAVYSLYVSESNSFTVNYLEGELDGKKVWAQPLKDGGYRVIYDADNDGSNGFTDKGTNEFKDYPQAAYYKDTSKLKLDYTDPESQTIDVTEASATYHGIQHPDGLYGGPKHNGFFAVLEEQQVFIDLNNDGYSDTWTLQDVTLYGGAKVASATIRDGELYIDGLYLGTYYLAEEIRDAISIFSTDNDDREVSEIRWLSFAAGYEADTDESGNPTKYEFKFPYSGGTGDDGPFDAEQDYVHKNTEKVSNQQVVKSAVQFKKITNSESSSSTQTTAEPLEGAGFTVYLISELSKIVDGTIAPAYSEVEGHRLVEANDLVKLYDESGNMVGYEFTKKYIGEAGLSGYFAEKYGDGYNLDDVNRIIYVKDRGYYYLQDILDAYINREYTQDEPKWDFSAEGAAIARSYEDDETTIERINKDFSYVANRLNNGSPCEWYGVNGISDGWVATGVKNEYRLAEVFTNHNGSLRLDGVAWGAYIMVETTTPTDKFTVDPYFFTVTDSCASANRAKSVMLDDASFVASVVLVKRDAQSGQDVLQTNTRFRIWDYTNERYISKNLVGENGALSMVAQRIFATDEEGRINAVASLETGRYRIEELQAPEGFHNTYWDYGNSTEGDVLGGLGADAKVGTFDNMLQKYYGAIDCGAVDFDVTTDRLYKASGITSSDNLDYVYIAEDYYDGEVQGKLTIQKTGEVLVGYKNTDDIEYADEYTSSTDRNYNGSKSMMKDRAVFERMKDHYDLGRDDVTTRELQFELDVDKTTPVKYFAQDRNGMYIAAIYEDGGKLLTLNGGEVYQEGCYVVTDKEKDERTFYPGAETSEPENVYAYTKDNETWLKATSKTEGGKTFYLNEANEVISDQASINGMKKATLIQTIDGQEVCVPTELVTEIHAEDGFLMFVYDLSIDTYEQAELVEVSDYYIYTVNGKEVNNSYLVHDVDGTLITNDYGVLTKDGSHYKLTYTEAIYDPDIDYSYTLKLGDGTEIPVRLVTGGTYLTEDGRLVKEVQGGGYAVENADRSYTTDKDATVELAEPNTGTTFDFVYEERPLAGATYEVRAAEDIASGDGGEGNYWFRKGDLVATVTTANDGEYVSFAPEYNKGGSYDSTYYYGNNGGNYTSLTKSNAYAGKEFATSGAILNKWISSRMSDMDKALFGTPAFTDSTIYPNTYYREDTQRFFRRFSRLDASEGVEVTDFMSRLELYGGLESEGYETITQLNDNGEDGFMLSVNETVAYPNGKLVENGDYYLLKGNAERFDGLGSKNVTGGDVEIEVAESDSIYEVTESKTEPWADGDYVTKTASGYRVVHTDAEEPGVNHGSTVEAAEDLGFTTIKDYGSATITDNGDGTYTLFDNSGTEILTMKGGLLVTEMGGIVKKAGKGYEVTYTVTDEYFSNPYVTPSFEPVVATMTVKDDTYEMFWNGAEKRFETTNGTYATFKDDYNTLSITMGGATKDYGAFDMLIEYDFHYAQKENIVEVEKDGRLGEVSLYLPLGKYTVQEVKTPYGFLINEKPQEVEFTYVDQVKEVVFNSDNSSIEKTQSQINIWDSKGLQWFVGGLNTIGEKLNDIFNTDFFTWGTYGDAEKPYYGDSESFINFFDLRVRSWSTEDVPEKPDGGPHKTEPSPGDEHLVSVGERITYEISYVNNTDETADVIIRDPIDKGNTFISADKGGTYDQGSHTVTWTVAGVAAGAFGTVQLVVEVNSKAETKVENTAYVAVGNNPEQQTETVENPITPDGEPHKTETDPGDGKVVEVGDHITYEITYMNDTAETADIIIRAPLDKGNSFISADNNGNYDSASRTVTWTIPGVASGASGKVKLVVQVNPLAVTKVVNTAYVKVGNKAEQQTETVENPLIPEGGPHKTEPDPGNGRLVEVGDHITYEITYTNYTDKTADVVIRDPLDEGNSFVSADNGGAYDKATHTVWWTVKNVESGASGKVRLVVEVNQKAVVEVENTAYVAVGNRAEQQTETVENPLEPDGNPHKTEPDPGNGHLVKVGDHITYEITYTNYKDTTADITIRDPLDRGNTFLLATDGGIYDVASHTVTWIIKGVAAGESGKVKLFVEVNANAKKQVENTAYVTVGNDSEQETETVENPLNPEGGPHKTEPDPGDGKLVSVGDSITYEITYTNYSDKKADIIIRDPLDKGNTFVSADNGGTYDEASHTVLWIIKNVASGASVKVQLKVQVNDQAGHKVVNTAYVTVGNDYEQQTETVENPLIPEDGPHKAELKPGDGEMVKVGDKITYEITYINNTSEEANIVVRDPLDKGNTFVSANKGGTYNAETHTVTWTIEGVPSGKSGKVKLVVQVNEDAVTEVENTAYVAVGNSPEQQTETVENPLKPDGEPHKTEPDPGNGKKVRVGDHITYEISYTNNTDKEADVIIRDPLDNGNTFISADNGGTYDEANHTVWWTIKGVAPGVTGKVQLVVQVNYKAVVEVENTAYVKVGNGHEQQTETVENPLEDEDRHEEPEEHQWKLGVGVYKSDKDTGAPLSGAKFGLYTTHDIYNADGLLLVKKDTLLATATTDQTGFANFGVDIAILSKFKDGQMTDSELAYTKDVTYKYTSMKDLGGGQYLLKVEGADDIILTLDAETGKYKTGDGLEAAIDLKTKTVTYKVTVSIDGNTAMNTGDYYIKEITPPEGYLFDPAVYDVEFKYDDEYTMYIPVYAKHQNAPTKVTLDKYELTGEENVPGAKVSVYRVRDIHDTNAEGLISHADSNLDLVDSWITDASGNGHEVTGLWLSNTEWPRLPNKEDRENVYVFREEIPAAGYTTAKDIEFKLSQIQGEDGWVDPATGEPYGYEVLVRTVTCDQDYISGSIITPTEHADSWIINGTAEESDWDYSRVLDAKTEIRWLLVNNTLVVSFEDDMNPETAAKVLKEEDFEGMEFDSVFLDFRGGKEFDVDFFNDKQVDRRPADSYLTFTQMWYTLDDLKISMYDDTTKMKFSKQDIVTGEDVVGAHLQITDPVTGNVIDSWVTEADEDGNIIEHYIEGVLEVNKEYILEETLAPTADGYVKSNSVKFTVLDDGSIQNTVMQDDFTKLEISKADSTTGEEVEGAGLELWAVDKSGKKTELIDKWTTGDDGYDENGKPNRHIIDYLEPGDYALVETLVPDGYLQAEEVHFTLEETGLLQKAVMYDDVVALYLYKYRTGTKDFVKGAEFQVYSVPKKYIGYMTENAAVTVGAKLAGDEEIKAGFVVNNDKKGTEKLSDYLTGAELKNTRFKDGWDDYSAELALDYSIHPDDMEAYGASAFVQELPEGVKIPENILAHEYTCKAGNDDAFRYTFTKDAGVYKVSVTFDEAYIEAHKDGGCNFTLLIPLALEKSLAEDGDIALKLSGSVSVSVAEKDIVEDKGSLNTDPLEIVVTKDDLAATETTTGAKQRVGGLAPNKWYVALETKAPDGYIIDPNPQTFYLEETDAEQALYFYNDKKPEKPHEPHEGTPEEPTPTPEITVTVVTPTGDVPAALILLAVAAVVVAGITIGVAVHRRKKKMLTGSKFDF